MGPYAEAPHLNELGVRLCREDGVALELGPHLEEVDLIHLRLTQPFKCLGQQY